jgi:hypothetical protein
MGADSVGKFETQLSKEASDSRLVLDLKDLTLVDQDVANFLGRSKVDDIHLMNSPAYIREWINGEHR